MRFKDREEAGKKLIERLSTYKAAKDAVVIALPRGGVVLGRVVADALGLPLDIVVARKIGAPGNKEYAIGAVTADGNAVWNETERTAAGDRYCDEAVRKEVAEAKRRLDVYRSGWPSRDLSGKTIIIVDDGIATGFTMRAAVRKAREEGAKRVVVAVPIAPPDVISFIAGETDEFIALDTPMMFAAIGGFYSEFPQVDDQTVVDLLHS